ncbi:MAG: hypothetical protein HY515_02410 [Candidatus Aenigmarchaeota archaeon]|nr:hypothetical protein [Candidatus Aenigmarchaeota archaeon]
MVLAYQSKISSQLEPVDSLVEQGLTVLRTGKLGKEKYDEPKLRLTGGISFYRRASDAFDRLHEPGEKATAEEKAGYNKTKGTLEILRNESRGYAKRIMENTIRQAEGSASSFKKQTDRERKGRKLLGVPFARRPSSSSVDRALLGYKMSVNSSSGYADSIANLLDVAGISTREDEIYANGVVVRFREVNETLDRLGTEHTGYVSGVSEGKASKTRKKTESKAQRDQKKADEKKRKAEEKAAKKYEDGLKKIDKQWEDEQKRHLATIRKKKWF